MINIRIIFSLSLFLVVCNEALAREPIVDYGMKDNASNSEIEFFVINPTEKYVCVSVHNWPDRDGRVFSENYIPILVVGTERFPQKYMGESDCFDFKNEGLCSIKIAPGETKRASIPYSTFDLPETLYLSNKNLVFWPPYYTSDNACIPE